MNKPTELSNIGSMHTEKLGNNWADEWRGTSYIVHRHRTTANGYSASWTFLPGMRDHKCVVKRQTFAHLFLDSISHPKFDEVVTNCQLREHTSILEFDRKYGNIIMREGK